MAIQIGGTQVISNGKDLQNIRNSTLNGWINGSVVATKAMAESGSINDRIMTPLRVKEAINAIGGNVIKRVIRGSTNYNNNGYTGSDYETRVNLGVTINMTKAFITQGNRGASIFMGGRYRGDGGFVGTGSARVTSSTTITVTAGNTASYYGRDAQAGIVDWELIEFN